MSGKHLSLWAKVDLCLLLTESALPAGIADVEPAQSSTGSLLSFSNTDLRHAADNRSRITRKGASKRGAIPHGQGPPALLSKHGRHRRFPRYPSPARHRFLLRRGRSEIILGCRNYIIAYRATASGKRPRTSKRASPPSWRRGRPSSREIATTPRTPFRHGASLTNSPKTPSPSMEKVARG